EEAVTALAERRIADWESTIAERVAEREAEGEEVTPARKLELLSELLTERGYATTARPLHVPLPAAGAQPGGGTRTLVRVQQCHGHCLVVAIATKHPVQWQTQTRPISHIISAPVPRLTTLVQGAHVCTTHKPLTEIRTPRRAHQRSSLRTRSSIRSATTP